MTDFELEEHRGWAVYTQNPYTGDWSMETHFGALHVHEEEGLADYLSRESERVEEVTIRPVCLGADPVQWAAVQMAMSLLDAIYAAQPCGNLHRDQCGCFAGYLASAVKAAFGIRGSLEREP